MTEVLNSTTEGVPGEKTKGLAISLFFLNTRNQPLLVEPHLPVWAKEAHPPTLTPMEERLILQCGGPC